jgi:pimeloyl-ACP methyl ester carboxylesterase
MSPGFAQADGVTAVGHVAAQTQHVEVNGIRYAYRRFGRPVGVPVVFLQHFRGGMDHWDPAVTDGLAASRPVILFDNAGVAGSSGEVPATIEAMADRAAEFLRALGLARVDLLGFSIGGYVAQALALRHPALVRRLILVGTGPAGGEPSNDPNFMKHATHTDPATGQSAVEDFLYLFFSRSSDSQRAGHAFWERRHQRQFDIDRPASQQAMLAQAAAGKAWREAKDEHFAYLERLANPTLVVSGSNDIMIPTSNSITLAQRMPNAQLIIYPDSGHGSLFQYPGLFVEHVRLFLDAADRN